MPYSNLLKAYSICFVKLVMLIMVTTMYSQEETKRIASTEQGWVTEANIGVDFLSNLLVNPAVGGGENRLGLGVSLEFNSIFNKSKLSWENYFNLDFGVQKVGNGYLEEFPDKKVPLQKSIDNIWLNSRVAFRTSYFSKFYYTLDAFFSSQITETFENNFLTDVTESGHPISKFLSPAVLQLSLGLEHRPNDYWKIFLAPASYKAVIVLDDDIANDFAVDNSGEFLGSIHGNPFENNRDGTASFQNIDHQIGGAFRMMYDNKVSERFAIRSNLSLFSNYLDSPEHIDVNWRNTVDFTIFKGFKLSLISYLNYDHDIFVQISDNSSPNGINGLGRRVSYTQQLSLRYNFIKKKEN